MGPSRTGHAAEGSPGPTTEPRALMRFVNPVQGSSILPYTGAARTPAEKVERLANGHMLFRITQPFSAHKYAVDMGNNECGDVVLATLDGTYRRAPNQYGGNIIIGEHPNGWRTVYAHLSEYNIPNVRSDLSAGAVIGYVGTTGTQSTGCHLHYEMWDGDTALNPALYLNRGDIPTYTDVPVSSPYYAAIEYARAAGLLVGVSGGRFGLGEPLTREQLAAVLYRQSRKV